MMPHGGENSSKGHRGTSDKITQPRLVGQQNDVTFGSQHRTDGSQHSTDGMSQECLGMPEFCCCMGELGSKVKTGTI